MFSILTMSAIISYKCSENCGFKVRLSYNMPIWKEGTPEHLQAVPVLSINRRYVAGYTNDRYCVGWRSVVSITEKDSPLMDRSIFYKIWLRIFRIVAIITKPDTTVRCPRCGAENSFLDEKCPDCKTGIICNDDRLTMWF